MEQMFSMRRRVPAIVCLLLLATLVSSSTVAADPQQQARTLFREGRNLFNWGKYKEALKKFHAARRLYWSFKIDLSIGYTLEAMGRSAEAAQYYEQFLLEDPERAGRDVEADVFKRLKGIRKKLATIMISTKVRGAVVEVDGEQRARTPQRHRLYLEPGRHRLTVRSEGRVLHEEQVELKAGQHLLTKVVAKQQRPQEPKEKSWLSQETKPPSRSKPFYKTWWFWTVVGAVVVGTTVGIAASTGGDDWLPNGDSGTIHLNK
jgi:tetratricopeptide (TPR) repeat protein